MDFIHIYFWKQAFTYFFNLKDLLGIKANGIFFPIIETLRF
jgi:hypothetical protein